MDAWLFPAIALSAVIVVFIISSISLRKLESSRSKNIKKSDEMDSVPSTLNKTVNKAKMKSKRLLNVQHRFTVTRRAIYLCLLAVAIGICVIPFLSDMPSMFVSIIIASLSVIIGIAAKPFIENMICGLVLCFGKLARIGDTVLVDGEYGVIEDVTLTHCIIKRWDWLRYVVPNSTMMTKEFVNYSIVDNQRWVYVDFFVDYSVDLKLVEEIAKQAPNGSEYFSGSEPARFWITELKPEAIKCMVVAWAISPSDGWMLSIDIRRRLLDGFKEHGIETHLHRIESKSKTKAS